LEKIKDEPALFIFGGIVMLTYGVISFFKVRKTSKEELLGEDEKDIIRKDYLSLFIKGFLLNFINIGVLGFWLAIIITWGPMLDQVPSRMFVFFVSVIATYFIIDLGKISLAKQLRSRLTVKNIMKIKQAISIILVVFGLALVVQGSFPDKMQSTIDRIEEHHENQ
jgi:threonine/homoserine/homoserine lactone efflux protein